MSTGGKDVSIMSDELPLVLQPAAKSDGQQPEDKNAFIFRVPMDIRNVNDKAYTPTAVTVGPLHKLPESGDNNPYIVTEKGKMKYINDFLRRTPVSYEELLCTTRELEKRVRDSYQEEFLHYDTNKFNHMMLRDSLFVIEYLLKIYERDSDGKSTIFEAWGDSSLMKDFSKLENQVPFSLLEGIYRRAGVNKMSFLELTLYYFKGFNDQNLEPKDVRPQHFTHLLRSFMLPRGGLENRIPCQVKLGYSASELSAVGVIFKATEGRSLVEIDFRGGQLSMAKFVVDELTEVPVRNVMALEHCKFRREAYVTDYFFILGSLIRTDDDAKILAEREIIVTEIRDTSKLVEMIQSLGLYTDVNTISSRYDSMCKDLKAYYEKRQKVSSIKRRYCENPVRKLIYVAGAVGSLWGLYELASRIASRIQGHGS